MQEIIIKCFGFKKIMENGHWETSEDFEREIPFRYRYGIDDEHLAKKAWSHAKGEIEVWDDTGEQVTFLSRIELFGEDGKFDVIAGHIYPSYAIDENGEHIYS